MTAEQKTVLALLNSAITNTPAEIDADCDWSAVIAEARQQAVLFMIFDVLSKTEGVPPEIVNECFQKSCAYLANNAKMGHLQKHLTKVLTSENIPYVILKGEAAASFYDKPELRLLGDVDFLIPSDMIDVAGEALVKAGYSKYLEGHICHKVYRRGDCLAEMHFALSGMPRNEKYSRMVEDFIKNIFTDAVQKDIGSGKFLCPSDKHNAVVFLLHMQHHMKGEGLGLRHLCDWIYFVNKTGSEPFWQDELIPFLEEINLFRFTKTFTKMCSMYLPFPCPDWAADADENVAAELFIEILDGGNFGRKDELRVASKKMVSNRGDGKNKGKLHNLYENLKCSVYEKHPILKKAPVLYPVLLVYRTARYALMMATGERVPLYKSLVQANKRIALYEKLSIFEEEK